MAALGDCNCRLWPETVAAAVRTGERDLNFRRLLSYGVGRWMYPSSVRRRARKTRTLSSKQAARHRLSKRTAFIRFSGGYTPHGTARLACQPCVEEAKTRRAWRQQKQPATHSVIALSFHAGRRGDSYCARSAAKNSGAQPTYKRTTTQAAKSWRRRRAPKR